VSKETSDFYGQLKNDAGFRQALIQQAYTKIPDFNSWKNRLDLSQHAHKIDCKVAIIHGKDDDVIPASESVLLHQLIHAQNPQVRLEVSPLLSHGDPKFGWKVLGEVASLARAFAYFLEKS
jgi:dipeptidyl aminopeptidase/acylaminoacyl peptidase